MGENEIEIGLLSLVCASRGDVNLWKVIIIIFQRSLMVPLRARYDDYWEVSLGSDSFGKFSLSLKPSGWRVPSLQIQKSSLRNSKFLICSSERSLLVISSMIITPKSRLKSCSGSLKCLSIEMPSGRFTSFLCLFTLLFICCFSTLPTY